MQLLASSVLIASRIARRWLALIAAPLLAVTSLHAQVVTFTDPNLEQAVRDTLQIYAPTNLYVTNMVTMTNLYAGYRGITNLGGLETATNLTLLDLGGNQVGTFNALTGTTHLVDLRLGNNQLASLAALSPATSVKLLDINGNLLTNFSTLPALPNLLRMSAGGNPLVYLTGIGAAPNLTNLDIGFCQVTNISAVTSLWHMVQFQSAWNHFWDASSLTGLTNMVYLDISGNRGPADAAVTNASFVSGMKHLQYLNLYYLRLNDLSPLAGLSSLTNLDVSWNAAPANLAVLNGFTNLLFLHIIADSISNITFVTHMPLLQDFECGYNNITDLSPTLGHNLTSLLVYGNPITNPWLVTNFPALTRLSVGSLGLSNVAFVGTLTNLLEFWVDGNTGLSNLAGITSLKGLQHLDINGCGFTNLSALTTLTNLNNLEMSGLVSSPSLAFLSGMTNLNSLDLSYDWVGDISVLSGLPQLRSVYLNNNVLGDITPLLSITSLDYYGYVDLRDNLLNLAPTNSAWNVITNLQANYVNVDYLPQNISHTITVWDSPLDQCVTNGALTYFAVSASTTAGDLQYQWQFDGLDLPGQTGALLVLSNVQSNQAGVYRSVLTDDNGQTTSGGAHLYVGDPNCGQTVFITQQPLNMVAAENDDVEFSVAAFTTIGDTNLNFQWQFNGTNIDGETDAQLDLYSVDTNSAGYYSVYVWNSNTDIVASAQAQLRIVDVVPFGDSSFSNMVYSALVSEGHTPPDGVIHLTDLDYLSYLDLGGQGITNISGLECARYLDSLDLSYNPIADPSPLSWLNNLTYLDLSDCGLQDASFVSSLYNLNILYLNDNTIHSIPVLVGLNNLTVLQINNNGCLINSPRLAAINPVNLCLHSDCIPDIAFCAGMTNLQVLDLGADWQYDENRNLVPDVSPLVGNPQMNWLSLSWDEVTNIPIVGTFTNLQHLFLSGNHFDSITFVTNLPGLQELNVNVSGVTNISPVAGHTPLYNLDVSYTAATNLTAVSGLTNLTTLWCGGNHAGGGGSYLSALTSLYLLGAELNGITNFGFITNMSNLYYLNLENNSITNVSALAGRTHMQYLYLGGNQIHDVSPLGGLTNTYYLSFFSNGLTNVSPLGGMYSLQWLTLQSNHVQNVSGLIGLTNLTYSLDLSVNELSDVAPLTNLYKLTWLGLWQNRLSSLPSMVGLSNVTSLDLWGNQLTNVSGVSGMASLNWLGLSRNNMKVVSLLSNLPNLQTIDLYTNQLTDASGVAGVTRLTWLNMNDNNLQTLSPYLGLTNLIYIGVEYNLLNINTGSPVLADIATFQSHNTYVDYIPQKSLFLAAPMLIGPGQFQFTIQGSSGTTLQIWSSTNLTTWSSLGFLTNTNGTVIFTDTSATNRVKAYRAQQL